MNTKNFNTLQLMLAFGGQVPLMNDVKLSRKRRGDPAPVVEGQIKQDRNATCACGSGAKFKKCCFRKEK